MDMLLKDADKRIDLYRKKEIRIKVMHDGQPVKNCPVRITQKKHQFLFGANCHEANSFRSEEENAIYNKLFTDVFNFATIDFYWGWYESVKGEKQKVDRMRLVNWCMDNGLEIIGHCIVWHFNKIIPDWLFHEEKSKIEGLILERIEDVVANFKDYIKYWTLVNEMTTTKTTNAFYDNPIGDWFEENGLFKAVKGAIGAAINADPEARLLINDFNVNNNKKEYYLSLLEELIEAQVPLRAIGIQAHMHGYVWTMEELWEVCNNFGKFGVPIHFVEISIVSGKAKNLDFFTNDNEWETGEEYLIWQEEYVRDFYTMVFSHPSVEAVTWWDIIDGKWLNAPSGLITNDLEPKRAYITLKRLIKENWWTDSKGVTDENGDYTERAFYGLHNITIGHEDSIKEFDINLDKWNPENQVYLEINI